MKDKSLVIVDYTLANSYGHQYQYAKNLVNVCKEKDISVKVYVNKAAANYNLEPKDIFIPFFDFPVDFSRIRSLFFIRKLSRDLLGLLKSFKNTDSVRFFVPNLFFPVEYLAWIKALKKHKAGVNIIFLLRYDIRAKGAMARALFKAAYSTIFKLWYMPDNLHKLYFVTDSKRLIPIWREIISPYNISIVPIPVFEVDSEKYERKPPPGDKIIVSIIGNLENRKGADILSEVISTLLSSERKTKYYFKIQCRNTNVKKKKSGDSFLQNRA